MGSYITAKRAKEKAELAGEPLVHLFTDTKSEDEDLYRFLKQTSEYLGGELVWLCDGRDLWELFNQQNMIANTRADLCSRILKRDLARKYVKERWKPDECVLYFGIDHSERHRIDRIRLNWEPYVVDAPLCEPPYLSKCEMIQECERDGIDPPRLYDLGASHNNCFSADTEFLTEGGVRRLGDCVGERVRVMGKKGFWTEAEVKSFGRQPVVKVTLSRYGVEKVIHTTSDHRWFKRDGRSGQIEVLTRQLQRDNRLVSVFGHLPYGVRPSAFGIAHGVTFGDGSQPTYQTNSPAWVVLCGEKADDLAKWFPLSPERSHASGLIKDDLPRTWRQLPSITESKSYLLGWLMGYFAADGSVTTGGISLSSSKIDNLNFVRDVAAKLGIGVGKIRPFWRKGFGDKETAVYSLSFVAKTLPAGFFLRERHNREYVVTERRPADWVVVSVETTNRVEEVYCAVVPNGHAFVLEGNVLTGNCGGFCVKGGHAHFAWLLGNLPDVFDYHADKEEEFRQRTGKDVAVMRDRRGGVSKPLPMLEFKRQVESGERQVDRSDWGKGCECFFPVVEDGVNGQLPEQVEQGAPLLNGECDKPDGTVGQSGPRQDASESA